MKHLFMYNFYLFESNVEIFKTIQVEVCMKRIISFTPSLVTTSTRLLNLSGKEHF